MREIFSEENRLKTMVKVELALLEGLAHAGLIPSSAIRNLNVTFNKDDIVRVREVEKEIKHETAALVKVLSEKIGKAGKFIHLGATSNDIIDTTWSLIIKEALQVIENKIVTLLRYLLELADKHLDTIMIGRTHGQHALPITLGFKIMNHAYEIAQCLERLIESHKRLFVLKMSGAVGTMAAWGNKGLLIEEYVAKKLGLASIKITTQVYSRDRFAELLCNLAILGSVLDRLATEIRNLQRPEIMELSEPFKEKQVGSSTMPHKANPVQCEKVTGLARFLRGLCSSSLENIVLWHERDLSNSSYERVTIPHAFLAIDEILETMTSVIKDLKVYAENMRRNLELSKDKIMAEALMVKLTLKGVPRNRAYTHLRELTRKSIETGKTLKEIALEDPYITSILSRNEIMECFDYEKYLGAYREICRRTKDYILELINKYSNCWQMN